MRGVPVAAASNRREAVPTDCSVREGDNRFRADDAPSMLGQAWVPSRSWDRHNFSAPALVRQLSTDDSSLAPPPHPAVLSQDRRLSVSA